MNYAARVILLMLTLTACQSAPQSRFVNQIKLDLPCQYVLVNDGDGKYAIEVIHNPGDQSGFATGPFDAAVTVQATSNHQTEPVLVDVKSDQAHVPIPGGYITAVAQQSCVAYQLPTNAT